MNQTDLSLDLLLKETLEMSEFIRSTGKNSEQIDLVHALDEEESFDHDYLFDLADKFGEQEDKLISAAITPFPLFESIPETPGILYKIDRGSSTFCVRGFTSSNLKESMKELADGDIGKRVLLKLDTAQDLSEVMFFSTQSFELAESIKDQILNRRFPFQEDALCNLSDPGFSWWMNVDQSAGEEGSRFEIYFRSHGINRAEKYIQLGPIGDGAIAALRLNQALALLKSSFPISEYSCDDKCFIVASSKPDHLSFNSFKNIFLYGINNTEIENFPDNVLGKTLYFYFHELAIVRKFWIEVNDKLG